VEAKISRVRAGPENNTTLQEQMRGAPSCASTEKDGTVAALKRTSRKIYERFIKDAMRYGTVWRRAEG
jgi:hypothetical protein